MRKRAPAVAGLFYPADQDRLQDVVGQMLHGAEESGDTAAKVVMAPHAGYVYSGQVAADVFSRVRIPDRVIIIGPNHTGLGGAKAIAREGVFSIPGADVPIDESLAAQVADLTGLQHDDDAHREEHSIEVELPFLVSRNPNVRIVPICLGHLPYQQCQLIGRGLADVLSKNDDVLVVVSSDMSHYLKASEAERLDSMALERIKAIDSTGLYDVVSRKHITMCGVIPATVALAAAQALRLNNARLITYANSGDISGDYNRVVGYASMLLN